ncbi:CDP-glycerol glycerophosphotransferase family protein [Escherichia coli]|nr:CDP-glycerol glycerophosphotransferase family protein [Escherichia coli]
MQCLASCEFLINNVSFPEYFIRKKGQRYLNTWHGTPIKFLGKDIKDEF